MVLKNNFERLSCLLISFALSSYGSELRKRYMLKLLLMCLEG